MIKKSSQELDVTLINDLKKKAEELKEQEERLKILFDYAPIGYFIMDLKGKTLDMNKEAHEQGGYSREDVIGKNILKTGMLPPDQILKATKMFSLIKLPQLAGFFLKKSSHQRNFGKSEFIMKRKDGRQITIEMDATLIRIKGQVFILGITKDITDRKNSEEKLAESEKRFKTIFENLTDEVIYLDKYGKILDVNVKVKDIFGYNPKEVIGKNFARLSSVSLKDMPKIIKAFKDFAMKGNAANTMELEVKNKKGNKVFVEASAMPVRKKGKIERIVASVRDISRQKELEKKIEQQREKYEKEIKELKKNLGE